VRVAPRGIVTDELRASRDARRPLGVSGFQGEVKQDAVSGSAAVGEATDQTAGCRRRELRKGRSSGECRRTAGWVTMRGHESILTTERYLGSEQDLKNAVNDALVFD